MAKKIGRPRHWTFKKVKTLVKKNKCKKSGDLLNAEPSAYQAALTQNWFKILGLSMSRGKRT